MKDWLKKRKRDMRREFSVFLVLVLALTGIPFPVRQEKGRTQRQTDGRWTAPGLFCLMTTSGKQKLTV